MLAGRKKILFILLDITYVITYDISKR